MENTLAVVVTIICVFGWMSSLADLDYEREPVASRAWTVLVTAVFVVMAVYVWGTP